MYKILFLFLFLFANNAYGKDLFLEVFVKLNGIRASNGLCKLTPNKNLAQAAQLHSDWMARNHVMNHLQGQEPKTLEEYKVCNHHPLHRIVNSGYCDFEKAFIIDIFQEQRRFEIKSNFNLGSEIIAAGKAPGNMAYNTKIIVDGWMRSKGHREAILTPQYDEIGIGISSPNSGEVYWCVVFGNSKAK
jgi:uncharacterized protein YkwD